MEHPGIGRLDRVDIGTLLRGELSGFAAWFAQPDRLRSLGDALGLRLEAADEPTSRLGRAGLVCRDADTGSVAVVEAQLGESRHDCFGRVLVRARERRADAAIWLAESFVHEHRIALEALGRAAGTPALFGAEIGLWRIGASPPALRFDVLVAPEDWRERRWASAAAARGPRRAPLAKRPPPRRAPPAPAPRRA